MPTPPSDVEPVACNDSVSSAASLANPPRRRFHLPLYARVLIGVAAGVLLGLTAGTAPFLNGYVFGWGTEELGGLGLLVIKALRALAVPLVLFAILDAFAQTRIAAKSGGKLILICLVNVSVAMCIGLAIMNIVKPGLTWQSHLTEIAQAASAKSHIPMPVGKSDDPEAPKATLELLPNIAYYVPSALARPFVYNNLISVVLIALLAGAALRRVLDKGADDASDTEEAQAARNGAQTVARFVSGTYQILVVMLGWVVQAVPVAVFAVVAKVVGASGVGVFAVLWTFLATALAGLAIHSLIYYPLVAWLVGKKPPREYLGKGADAILTGLSTNSSLATVPITLRCLDKMRVSPANARLAACVGTNLNNDGITLYEAIAALFLAQAVGMNLGLGSRSSWFYRRLWRARESRACPKRV